MAERSFLSDILQRVARAGRARLALGNAVETDLIKLCEDLIGDLSEASGLTTALQVLDRFEAYSPEEKLAFFQDIADRFGVDDLVLEQAISNWAPGDDAAARKLHFAAEPKSQELIRRLNRVPGATARLVKMRAALLLHQKNTPGLKGLDEDFQHLFSSWFNRGFLEIRRIDWSTSAEILEKIITYEAVHEISGWDDLRQRVAADDRRLFAFFHPAMPKDPLIFVEVALMDETPGAITPIINARDTELDPNEATTAVFYSISNCQKGLRGISFGNFLIKQVVAELQNELPGLVTFVTLSPVPGLGMWLQRAA
ncbi:MAG: malonyl-CoA decarboxylase, partial [Rhodobacteraceae bacterium]|nr:malonyl-CoA decarboxylase [Paracoccaceae bacterium]